MTEFVETTNRLINNTFSYRGIPYVLFLGSYWCMTYEFLSVQEVEDFINDEYNEINAFNVMKKAANRINDNIDDWGKLQGQYGESL